ncbi:MAG: hypothetical protein EOL95_06725 [Bacteroidia bacterium]|nr:hypothetical protein [Bacteroidia bacterium]
MSKLTRIYLPLVIYIWINALFLVKYLSRLTIWYGWSVIAYVIAIFAVFAFSVYYFPKKSEKFFKLCVCVSVVLFVAASLFLSFKIDPYELNVDRWSAIHNFLFNMLNGIYPYSAQTHLGGYGSPFPFWQIFHLPFYALGNVGYSSVFVILLFVLSLCKTRSFLVGFKAMLLLCMSPAIWYEIIVRSDFMANFLLCATVINYMHSIKFDAKRHIMLSALIIGLFLSTRWATAIPFAVYLFPSFYKWKFKQQFSLILLSCLVFALTFIPFILWDYDELLFFDYNPFILQTRQGSIWDLLLVVPIGIWTSLRYRSNNASYAFQIAFVLFMSVAVAFVHTSFKHGMEYGLFDQIYDICYFNMALVFLILGISIKNQADTSNEISA